MALQFMRREAFSLYHQILLLLPGKETIMTASLKQPVQSREATKVITQS